MKMTHPKVSVFLPTYNQKHFVRETIESILTQNYPNLEVVVGDDGSVDGTQEILLEYKEKYPELFKLILSSKNEGITANCNKILKECTGEYIALFAGDDIWLPGKLLKQVDLMQKKPGASLCVSKVEWFESNTNKTMFIYPSGDFNVENMSIIDIAYYIGCTGASMLVRSNAIPKYGYETSLPMVSDWLFFIEILRNGDVIFINESLARYRRHGASMSNYPDLIFKEHMQTLFLLENKYEDMREDVSSFIRKYILINAVEIFKKSNNRELKFDHLQAIFNSSNYELKRDYLNAILKSSPGKMLVKSTFKVLGEKIANKLVSELNRIKSCVMPNIKQ